MFANEKYPYIQLGNRKYLTKENGFCEDESFYAWASVRPLTDYNELYPRCSNAHISLKNGRGLYVSCQELH